MAPRISDTSPEAEEVYFRRLAELTPSEKLRIGVGLCEAGHTLQLAVMRQTYPHADENEILWRIAKTRYGAELASKVYGRR